MDDLISRQAAIDAVDSETASANPEHFKSSEKFIEFMDDVDIASFGKWQWTNGFNTALVATQVQLKKLPSAQSERKRGEWIYGENDGQDGWYCSECGGFVPWDYDYYGLDNIDFIKDFKTCPRCDARMISYTGMEKGEQE